MCTLKIIFLLVYTDAVWMPQEWKGSVKVIHLVIAIQNHFERKAQDANLTQSRSDERTDHETNTLPEIPVEDMWVLNHITVYRVQSLMEALDDDGSSFVTVDKVNAFTSRRPEGWR